MNKQIFSVFLIALFFNFSYAQAAKHIRLSSPDNTLTIQVSLNDKGIAVYQVEKSGKTVIQPSIMGLTGDVDFSLGLTLSGVQKVKQITQTYNAPAEKRANRTFTANTTTFHLKNKAGKKLIVELAATNEGIAFRYLYQSKTPVKIKGEKTTFKFDAKTKAWLHPHADAKTGWCNTQPSYEEQYIYDIPVGFPAPLKAGWSFPALFNSGDKWILLTESGLTPDYVGTRLAQKSPNGEYAIEFPQRGETIGDEDPNYVVAANVVSAWRVIVIGSLAQVVESQMVTDFSPDAGNDIDYSWVKPGHASWSWGVLHDNFTIYPVQKLFIDYASEMKWEYCLVDADWDWKIKYDSIQMLVDHGKQKNVGVLLWYNSSGPWNTTVYSPKSKLFERESRRAEFKKIHEMGVKGIKVDFWPGDGQSTIQYYYDLLKDAAEFKLLVNFHGTTIPRGWSRTFPHLMSMESIRGFEFTTFDQKDTDLAPKHMNMAPYARNIVGPMDFTPVCFGEIIGKKRRTSNAFELALTVVFQSGIQHFVEVPESMAKQPDYVKDYMRNIPVSWDDVRLLAGFPGKYTVIARKSGSKWYIGGVNGQSVAQPLTLDLSALNFQGTSVSLITDGENNRSFSQDIKSVQNAMVQIDMKPDGGFVIVL